MEQKQNVWDADRNRNNVWDTDKDCINIWIAKRNRKNACMLKDYLEQKEDIDGVRVFTKGNRVFQLLGEESPDMLILDTDLEDMAGFALLHRIREERGEIPS